MKKNYLISIAILMTLLFTEAAYACRCGRPTVEKAFEEATVIFSGEVTKLDYFQATLKVQKIWKGKSTQEIVLLTGQTISPEGYYRSSSCDFSYSIGEKYLIYAYGSENNLKTSFSSRSKILKDDDEDIQELEKLTSEYETAVQLYSHSNLQSNLFELVQAYQPLECLKNVPF